MSYTSSAPSQDVQAILESSAYSGIPSSTAPCAQSSQASYPSLGSPPYSCAVVLQRAYPYHFNASNSAKIQRKNENIRTYFEKNLQLSNKNLSFAALK
jgi:hypothetical protein